MMLIVRYILFRGFAQTQNAFCSGAKRGTYDDASSAEVKRRVLAPAIHSCENCGRFHPWRYRLKVRTEPSQGSNPGSSPGIATKKREVRLLYMARLDSLLFEVLLVIFLRTIKL
jgi:hypothetical protein